LKVKCDEPLSNFAFKVISRLYSQGAVRGMDPNNPERVIVRLTDGEEVCLQYHNFNVIL
jgi:hypothetical protein